MSSINWNPRPPRPGSRYVREVTEEVARIKVDARGSRGYQVLRARRVLRILDRMEAKK